LPEYMAFCEKGHRSYRRLAAGGAGATCQVNVNPAGQHVLHATGIVCGAGLTQLDVLPPVTDDGPAVWQSPGPDQPMDTATQPPDPPERRLGRIEVCIHNDLPLTADDGEWILSQLTKLDHLTARLARREQAAGHNLSAATPRELIQELAARADKRDWSLSLDSRPTPPPESVDTDDEHEYGNPVG
jgi:hypothetical protein